MQAEIIILSLVSKWLWIISLPVRVESLMKCNFWDRPQRNCRSKQLPKYHESESDVYLSDLGYLSANKLLFLLPIDPESVCCIIADSRNLIFGETFKLVNMSDFRSLPADFLYRWWDKFSKQNAGSPIYRNRKISVYDAGAARRCSGLMSLGLRWWPAPDGWWSKLRLYFQPLQMASSPLTSAKK